MAEVIIRDVQAADDSDWLILWNRYLNFFDSELPVETSLATWHRFLSTESQLFCRVAEVDNHIVGFAILVLHEGAWVTDPVCYLENLYVDPSMRGMGVGSAIIKAIYDEATRENWSKVYWVTQESSAARKLYDKFAQSDDYVRYNMPV